MDPRSILVHGDTSLQLGVLFPEEAGQPTPEPMLEIMLIVFRSGIQQPGRIVQAEGPPSDFSFRLPLSADLFPDQIEHMLSHVGHPHRGDVVFWTERISSYAIDAAIIMLLDGRNELVVVAEIHIFPTAVHPHSRSISDHAQTVDEVLMLDEDLGEEELMDELLLEEEAEGAGGEFGAAPASESSVKALESTTYQGDGSDGSTCTICLEDFEAGVELISMPCSHKFHQPCARQWLERSHFCPLCRYAMPTVDWDGVIE